jgi:hypothetical protein
MSIYQKKLRACPACHEQKSINTKMVQHLYDHCSVVRQLKRQAENGELSIPEVAARVSEFVSLWKAHKSSQICGCVLRGTNFCERIVPLIQWDNSIFHYLVAKGKTQKTGYVKFVSSLRPFVEMEVRTADFRQCAGGRNALTRMLRQAIVHEGHRLPPSVLGDPAVAKASMISQFRQQQQQQVSADR